MTSRAYSLDLRERVIKYLEEGNSQRLASKVFKISKTTVNTWRLGYKRDGSYAPKKRIGSSPSIKMNDFVKYVKSHSNARSLDIGKEFNMSASGARYWLRRFGFTYKKKPLAMWKQSMKDESST